MIHQKKITLIIKQTIGLKQELSQGHINEL